jgi:hypothetical protein
MRKLLSVLVVGWSLGSFPAVAADVILSAGPGIIWNPSTPGPIKKDDVLVVRQADSAMSHGFVFIGAGAPSTIPRCGSGTPAAGTIFCEETPGASSGYNVNIPPGPREFLRLKALQDLPADMSFHCTVHTGAMTGTLKK